MSSSRLLRCAQILCDAHDTGDLLYGCATYGVVYDSMSPSRVSPESPASRDGKKKKVAVFLECDIEGQRVQHRGKQVFFLFFRCRVSMESRTGVSALGRWRSGRRCRAGELIVTCRMRILMTVSGLPCVHRIARVVSAFFAFGRRSVGFFFFFF